MLEVNSSFFESLREGFAGNITDEVLVGRNYYHYIDGECSEEQPFVLETYFSDYEDTDELFSLDFDVADFSDDCWVKRISGVNEEENTNYLILISVDNGFVNSIRIEREVFYQSGSGMFYIPGVQLPIKHEYISLNLNEEEIPKLVKKELMLLSKRRYLSDDYSFQGKLLPFKMRENAGPKINYTYALQSSYRMAYMHVSIDTSTEGVVKSLEYSTYQSTGSAYGDMFSRPELTDDRHEEIVEMLLYLLDMYDDEEYKELDL